MNTSSVAITGQPESAPVCEGDEVTFTIIATDATSYQWQKDGTDISGATTDTYTINSVATIAAGDYTCIASDACGSVPSNSATLAVKLSTEITQQPDDINANEGEDISLNVVATGTSLTYQWRFNGANIEGADTATYQILSVTVDNAGNYDVVVTGECGERTSDVAVLSITTTVEKLTEYDINIYPNPSKGLISIELKDFVHKDLYIEITNMYGEIIYNKQLVSLNKKETIDLSGHAKGLYLIKVFNDKILKTKKMVLE
ncbi:unnamed protein product [marine sediment metagenome]|uniref:Ig-like domain-containing protein n=1 Tax=marine sediment metagenome TaxID=412755 RepID=X1N4I4_9ZZZZ